MHKDGYIPVCNQPVDEVTGQRSFWATRFLTDGHADETGQREKEQGQSDCERHKARIIEKNQKTNLMEMKL